MARNQWVGYSSSLPCCKYTSVPQTSESSTSKNSSIQFERRRGNLAKLNGRVRSWDNSGDGHG